MNQCIVCESKLIESFQTSDKKKHWKCLRCFAKFLDKKYYIDSDIEKERYLEHENIIEDEGYRNFLSRLSIPLKEKLLPSSKGLDFGCGHGPALADILIKDGFDVDLYDPFFLSR
jgi:2-polyprenyl-3-methyl-5-hydroxy-6-metoxy-1,4-benzoquinol methylase